MSECKPSAPAIPNTNPDDLAGGSAYFRPGCTVPPGFGKVLNATVPPDLSADPATYFIAAPIPPVTVYNDEQTATLYDGTGAQTVPANTLYRNAPNTPQDVAQAKIELNRLALELAMSQIVVGNQTYSLDLCAGVDSERLFYMPFRAVLSVSSGALPPGLSLSTPDEVTGALTGAPTAAGSFAFTVQAAVPGRSVVTVTFAVKVGSVNSPAIMLAYAQGQTVLDYLDYTNPYGGAVTWSIVNGALPTGLSMSGGGIITGTPSAPGFWTATVQASNGGAFRCSKAITFQVFDFHITNDSPLPDATVGAYYQVDLTATGLPGDDLSWGYLVGGGSLPPGLTCDGQTINGTPLSAGIYNFSLIVEDLSQADGCRAIKAFTLTVN